MLFCIMRISSCIMRISMILDPDACTYDACIRVPNSSVVFFEHSPNYGGEGKVGCICIYLLNLYFVQVEEGATSFGRGEKSWEGVTQRGFGQTLHCSHLHHHHCNAMHWQSNHICIIFIGGPTGVGWFQENGVGQTSSQTPMQRFKAKRQNGHKEK